MFPRRSTNDVPRHLLVARPCTPHADPALVVAERHKLSTLTCIWSLALQSVHADPAQSVIERQEICDRRGAACAGHPGVLAPLRQRPRAAAALRGGAQEPKGPRKGGIRGGGRGGENDAHTGEVMVRCSWRRFVIDFLGRFFNVSTTHLLASCVRLEPGFASLFVTTVVPFLCVCVSFLDIQFFLAIILGSKYDQLQILIVGLRAVQLSEFGLNKLVALLGKLIVDNTPEARDVGKRLVGPVRTAYTEAAKQAKVGGGKGWGFIYLSYLILSFWRPCVRPDHALSKMSRLLELAK